jgi:hypothetical protein
MMSFETFVTWTSSYLSSILSLVIQIVMPEMNADKR